MTRFRSSVRRCIMRNFGMASSRMIPTRITNTATATPVANVHCQLLPAIFRTAQTAVIGALMSICSPMTTNISTCVTSLVVRVIRLAVEKRPISSMEKDSTLSNSLARREAENPEAICAASSTVATEAAMLPSAQSSIMPPLYRMSRMALPSVSTSVVICDI